MPQIDETEAGLRERIADQDARIGELQQALNIERNANQVERALVAEAEEILTENARLKADAEQAQELDAYILVKRINDLQEQLRSIIEEARERSMVLDIPFINGLASLPLPSEKEADAE